MQQVPGGTSGAAVQGSRFGRAAKLEIKYLISIRNYYFMR